MTKDSPMISVILPAYNAEDYLDQAIKSVQTQTFQDFEFIIINDGSIDATATIIDNYASNDHRIRAFHQSNMGLVHTLNRGLDLARGKYVVRLDSDDECLPKRFERLTYYMEHNKSVAICGTGIEEFGDTNKSWRPMYTDHDSIKCALFFRNVIVHPSVIIRLEALKTFGLKYNPQYQDVEDYELWVRASHNIVLSNIHEILYRHRRHHAQISQNFQNISYANFENILQSNLDFLGISPSPEEMELHKSLCLKKYVPSLEYLRRAENWLLKLQNANLISASYPEPFFSKVVASEWFGVCKRTTRCGLKTAFYYSSSTFPKSANVSLLSRIIFFLNCSMKMGSGRITKYKNYINKFVK